MVFHDGGGARRWALRELEPRHLERRSRCVEDVRYGRRRGCGVGNGVHAARSVREPRLTHELDLLRDQQAVGEQLNQAGRERRGSGELLNAPRPLAKKLDGRALRLVEREA